MIFSVYEGFIIPVEVGESGSLSQEFFKQDTGPPVFYHGDKMFSTMTLKNTYLGIPINPPATSPQALLAEKPQ